MRRRKRITASIAGVILALSALTLGRTGQSQAPVASGPPSLSFCLRHGHHPCLAPAQVRAIYGVDALLRRGITGKGRTIAIIDSFGSPTLRADLHGFDRAFGLSDPRLDILSPLGAFHPRETGWVGETTLDVEWAHVIAPDARIVVLESPVDETEGVQGLPEFLKLERYAVDHHLADVVSQSWAATENTLFDAPGRAMVAQLHRFYVWASARGVTFLGASGDDGAAGPNLALTGYYPYRVVQYPASDPLVLAIGGTVLSVDPRGRLREEAAWSGSGGGISKLFAEPIYQRTLPSSVQRLLHGARGLPDVALNAAPESSVLVYQDGKWGLAAGTSAATPQWAGLVALADQLAGHDLGSINGALYRLAASPRYRADLRDITVGGNAAPYRARVQGRDVVRLGGIAYPAGPGWDAVTGLGSPLGATLVPDLVRVGNLGLPAHAG